MRPNLHSNHEFAAYKKILNENNPFSPNERVVRQNTIESSIANISAQFEDMTNQSISNVSSVFMPSRRVGPREEGRFVRIKEKILNQTPEMSQTVDWSSYITGNLNLDSVANLSKEIDESSVPSIFNEEEYKMDSRNTLGRPSAFEVVKPSIEH